MKNDPSRDEELIERLRRGDSTSFYEIYNQHQEAITLFLRKRWNNFIAKMDSIQGEHLILSALTDALMELVNNPARFDPERGSLRTFLIGIAQRRMSNSYRKEVKGRSVFSFTDVGLEKLEGNNGVEGSPLESLEARELLELIRKMLKKLFPNEPDFTLALMILEGVRPTDAYSLVLEICDMASEEQRELVNKHKDRLKKQMQRNGIYDYIKKLKGL